MKITNRALRQNPPEVVQRPEWFESALAQRPRESSAAVGEARVAYLEWGDRNNPTVMLVHGNGAHHHWFAFLAPQLAQRYHLVAMTFSGMGDSQWRDYYDREVFMQDVLGVLNEVSPDAPACLVAHSFGGIACLLAASEHPQRVAQLVLCDFVARKPERHQEWFEGREPARPTRVYAARKEILERFRLMPEQYCANRYIIDYIAGHSVRKVVGGWTWKFDHRLYDDMLLGRDLPERLRNLSMPVALMYGQYTVEFEQEDLDYAMSLVPKAPVVMIEEAEHHFFLDQPLAFVRELDALLGNWYPASA